MPHCPLSPAWGDPSPLPFLNAGTRICIYVHINMVFPRGPSINILHMCLLYCSELTPTVRKQGVFRATWGTVRRTLISPGESRTALPACGRSPSCQSRNPRPFSKGYIPEICHKTCLNKYLGFCFYLYNSSQRGHRLKSILMPC